MMTDDATFWCWYGQQPNRFASNSTQQYGLISLLLLQQCLSGHNLWYHLSILSGRTSHNGIWLAQACVVKTTEWVDTSQDNVYIGTVVTNPNPLPGFHGTNTLTYTCVGLLTPSRCICASKQENMYNQTCFNRWQVYKLHCLQWITTWLH